jgi:membrane associated rhomboid family serine protease
MAFRSNGPTMVALPPFRGVTRRIILISVICYFLLLVLGMVLPNLEALLTGLLVLEPDKAFGKQLWQFITYPFFGNTLLGLLFAALSIWFFGSSLEDERGSRWMGEYFLVTTIGGGLIAGLLSFPASGRIEGISAIAVASGLWPFTLALVVAFATFHPEETLRFNFILTLKAKYMAAIYILLYLVFALIGPDRLNAVTVLCSAGVGYAFLRIAPRHGVRVAASEQLFGLRNAFYRAKRRRAAKKFTVYMRKQGKDVSLDAEGRYIDPEGTPRDPNDRRWMN